MIGYLTNVSSSSSSLTFCLLIFVFLVCFVFALQHEKEKKLKISSWAAQWGQSVWEKQGNIVKMVEFSVIWP